MTRPSDAHWALLDERAPTIARATLQALHDARVPHILGGGWAVYAHQPSTPSVDCDVYLENGFPPHVQKRLTDAGYRVGPRREIEPLGLHERVEFLGTGDDDLGIPFAGFTPSDLFEGRTHARDLPLDPPLRAVTIPDAPSLAIAKTCALRARTLGYLAHTDGTARMLLGPQLAPMMLSLPHSYYLRKAGKDLFDVSLLLRNDSDFDEMQTLCRRFQLGDAIRETFTGLPDAILELAEDLADRVHQPSPLEWRRQAVARL